MESDEPTFSSPEEDTKIVEEINRHHIHISATQALATTFVAVVVVTAMFVPALETSDAEVFIDGKIDGSLLFYMVSVSSNSEDTVFYAIVLQDGSIIDQQVVEDGFAENSLSITDTGAKYAVEVRTGSPPLFVLEHYDFESSSPSIYVELDYLTPGQDTLEYGLWLNGTDATATVSLYDPETGENLYSISISEGYQSDSIKDLTSDHTYYFTVSDESNTYFYQEVTTSPLPTSVELDYLTPGQDTLEYGLTLNGTDATATVSLYDPETQINVYSISISEGYHSDTIRQLSPDHTYYFTVSDESNTYLNREVTTSLLPTSVELDYLTPGQDTLEYGLTLNGTDATATVSLYDATGASLYSISISEGYHSDTISQLSPGYTYYFKVSDGSSTYLNREVTTSLSTSVELDHLTPDESSLEYGLTLNGTDATATVSLYDPETGENLYSISITEGYHSDSIHKLTSDHTYYFIVSDESNTYLNQEVRTSPMPTSVELDYLTPGQDTLRYGLTLYGTDATATVSLYDATGASLYSISISEGYHSDTISQLSPDHTYYFTVSDESNTYLNQVVTTT